MVVEREGLGSLLQLGCKHAGGEPCRAAQQNVSGGKAVLLGEDVSHLGEELLRAGLVVKLEVQEELRVTRAIHVVYAQLNHFGHVVEAVEVDGTDCVVAG